MADQTSPEVMENPLTPLSLMIDVRDSFSGSAAVAAGHLNLCRRLRSARARSIEAAFRPLGHGVSCAWSGRGSPEQVRERRGGAPGAENRPETDLGDSSNRPNRLIARAEAVFFSKERLLCRL